MKAYQSTAAQVGEEAFATAYAKAAAINMNRPYQAGGAETIIRAVRRLSKKAASRLISDLLDIKAAA